MGSELSAHQKLLLEMLKVLTLYVAGMVFGISCLPGARWARSGTMALFLGMMIWT